MSEVIFSKKQVMPLIGKYSIDVENDNKLIEDYRLEIKRYIDTKDIFYKYVRRNREKDKNK